MRNLKHATIAMMALLAGGTCAAIGMAVSCNVFPSVNPGFGPVMIGGGFLLGIGVPFYQYFKSQPWQSP